MYDHWYHVTMATVLRAQLTSLTTVHHLAVADLTAQLAAARQKVWEEAAELVDEYKSTGGTTWASQAIVHTIAARCREQARKAPRK